jgi:hypothetical protein
VKQRPHAPHAAPCSTRAVIGAPHTGHDSHAETGTPSTAWKRALRPWMSGWWRPRHDDDWIERSRMASPSFFLVQVEHQSDRRGQRWSLSARCQSRSPSLPGVGQIVTYPSSAREQKDRSSSATGEGVPDTRSLLAGLPPHIPGSFPEPCHPTQGDRSSSSHVGHADSRLHPSIPIPDVRGGWVVSVGLADSRHRSLPCTSSCAGSINRSSGSKLSESSW